MSTLTPIRVLRITPPDEDVKPLYRDLQSPKTLVTFDYNVESPYATDIGLHINFSIPTIITATQVMSGAIDMIYYEDSYYLIWTSFKGAMSIGGERCATCHHIWKDGRNLYRYSLASENEVIQPAIDWIKQQEAA